MILVLDAGGGVARRRRLRSRSRVLLFSLCCTFLFLFAVFKFSSPDLTGTVLSSVDSWTVCSSFSSSSHHLYSVSSVTSCTSSVSRIASRSLTMVFRSMSSDGVEHQFQAVSARNTQHERYLPYPALRASILPLQDMYVDARVLVGKRIVSKLSSLQYATNRSLEDRLLIVKLLVVIGSVDIHFSPMRFHCSYRPDLVLNVDALTFRPDWDSQSSTIISMPLTSCGGDCLCCTGEEPALPLTYIAVCTRYLSYMILYFSQSQFDRPTCVCGVPRSTWRQDSKDQRGTITPLLAIVKMTHSPLLYARCTSSLIHVACAHQPSYWICLWLPCSLLLKSFVEAESIFPSFEPCLLGSEPHVFPFGAIVGIIPKKSSQVLHQRSTPTRATIKLISTFSRGLSKLEDCSPLAFFLTEKASKTSSCQGHERSFSTILLIVGVHLSTSTPPHKRYLSPGLKASEHRRFPNRLISCVMVCLGPEDTTRIIPMRLEVMEHSTSRHTVTISKSEDFGRRNFFSMRLLASGSFDINFDTLSNFSKFVSLSLVCYAFKFPKKIAHHMFDGAWIHVNLKL